MHFFLPPSNALLNITPRGSEREKELDGKTFIGEN